MAKSARECRLYARPVPVLVLSGLRRGATPGYGPHLELPTLALIRGIFRLGFPTRADITTLFARDLVYIIEPLCLQQENKFLVGHPEFDEFVPLPCSDPPRKTHVTGHVPSFRSTIHE
eukprot:1344415-Rhodomonas_salina.1